MTDSVADFYDGFAADYDLVYGGNWDAAVDRQGLALDRVIQDATRRDRPARILDCSCGIGTQAIGLARLGHTVVGTDISERALERARVEARRLGVEIDVARADFRDLSGVDGSFDVVLSCDNSLPHLLDDANLERALRAMHGKVRPYGLLVLSIRDYDRALTDRPAVGDPIVVPGAPRRVLVRLHDWDADGSPFYTVRFLVLVERGDGWTVTEHRTRYRAVTRAQLAAAAERAGFGDLTWLTPDEAGFHQPVLTARRV